MKRRLIGCNTLLFIVTASLMLSGCGGSESKIETDNSESSQSLVAEPTGAAQNDNEEQAIPEAEPSEKLLGEPMQSEELLQEEGIDLMEVDVLSGTYWQGAYYEEFFSADLDGTRRTVLPRNGFNYELYLNEDGTALFTDYNKDGIEDNHIVGTWERDEDGDVVLVPERESGEIWMEQNYIFYPKGRELQMDWAGAYRIHLVEKSDTERVSKPLLKDRLVGTYMALSDEEPDSYEIVNVTYEHGILMIESQLETKEDGEVWSFWAEEFWPDDDALISSDVALVRGTMGEFSVMGSPGYGVISEDVVIKATDTGFTVTKHVDDYTKVTYEYQAIEEKDSNRCHSSLEELQAQLPMDASRPSNLVGSYGAEGDKSSLRITLRKDGSATVIDKMRGSEDSHIVWIDGAWCVNKEDNLLFVGEQVGYGTMPIEFELSMDDMMGNILLSDINGDAPFPDFYHAAVDRIDEDEPFSRGLISDWHQVVARSRLEVGDFETEYGEPMMYWYEVPKVNEDTAGTRAINKKIDQKYGVMVDESLRGILSGEDIGTNELYYVSGHNDSIYTIAVYYTEWYSGMQEYDAFYYDQSSGKEISAAEFLQKMGLSEKQFLAAVKKEATEIYKDRYADLTAAQKEELGYEETLESMDEYINMTLVKPFLSESGELVAAAPIASLIGPAWEYTGVTVDYE